MVKAILIFVISSLILAGFEGVADAAGPTAADGQDHSHELHGSVHADGHEHDGASDHDDHFCHCSVHAVALLSAAVMSIPREISIAMTDCDSHFSSQVPALLLRPPNS